jgi:hypothetical protein
MAASRRRRPYGTNSFTEAVGGVRRLTRQDRNRAHPTTPAQRAQFLQLTTDECAGGDTQPGYLIDYYDSM